jgi:hypothetical protein
MRAFFEGSARSQGIEKVAVKPADAFWGSIYFMGMPDELGVQNELTEPIILIAIAEFEGTTYLYDITRSGLIGDVDFSSSDAAEHYAEEEFGPGVQWQIPPEDKTLRQILDEIPKDSSE